MTLALSILTGWLVLGLGVALVISGMARAASRADTTTSIVATIAAAPSVVHTPSTRTPAPAPVPVDVAVAAHGLRAIADVLVDGMDGLRQDWHVMAPEVRTRSIASLIDQGEALRAVLDDLVLAAPAQLAATLDDLGGDRPLTLPRTVAIA